MSDPYALPFTRDHLTDGYISYTFGSRNAESNIVRLFQVVAPFVRAIRHWSGAFYVLNQPSQYSPPALSVYGRNAWLLDYAVRSGGSVVPQQLQFPQGEGDRRRYVDQVQFRVPVFFVNTDGNLGVPLMDAAAGRMQLLGADLPPQLADKTMIKIRIGWPGYAPFEQRIELRDQTPARSPITLESFVKHVGICVRQCLADCERAPVQDPTSNWTIGHGNITSDEVKLIGLVQVSEASWTPILQLMRRIVR